MPRGGDQVPPDFEGSTVALRREHLVIAKGFIRIVGRQLPLAAELVHLFRRAKSGCSGRHIEGSRAADMLGTLTHPSHDHERRGICGTPLTGRDLRMAIVPAIILSVNHLTGRVDLVPVNLFASSVLRLSEDS